MMNQKNLKYMVELLEDDSHEVRDEILKQLSSYGYFLETDIKEFSDIINEPNISAIKSIIENNRRNWLESNWLRIKETAEPLEKIETALNLISKFQFGLDYEYELSDKLTSIADDFRDKVPYGDEIDLATFLFQENGIKGDQGDYYNPFNSNAVFALSEKKSNPITLCLVYALIGERLGFNIVGCNFPGHFLAKVVNEDEYFLVDCFNGGKIIFESDISNLAQDSIDSVKHIIREIPSANTIIKRVLSNLIKAYSINQQFENQELFTRLSATL